MVKLYEQGIKIMANHRNRVTLDCERCKKSFWIIKSRENKARRHFCSATCRNLTCGEEKRLHQYPKKIGNCKRCNKDIIAKYAGMDKPWRTFCSKSCVTSFRNATIPQSEKQRVLASERMKSLWGSPEYRTKMSSDERRKKMSEINTGDKSHFWIDGRTGENRRMRNSYLSKDWRTSIFQRDNYTCQICGSRSGVGKAVKLNADHIKPWSIFPELRFDINNGRTLCLDCHKNTETFGHKMSVLTQKFYLKGAK